MNERGDLAPVRPRVELRSLVVRPRLVRTMIIVGTIPYERIRTLIKLGYEMWCGSQ